MKKSFAPILMSFFYRRDGKTVLFGVNDTLQDKNISYECGQKTLNGETLWKESGVITLSPTGSFLQALNRNIEQNNTYLYVSYSFDGEKTTTLYSWDFWSSAKFESDYKSKISQIDKNRAAITIKANKFAKSVFVNFPENYKYDYSDNYIDVEPGEEKTIYVFCKDGVNISKVTITDILNNG